MKRLLLVHRCPEPYVLAQRGKAHGLGVLLATLRLDKFASSAGKPILHRVGHHVLAHLVEPVAVFGLHALGLGLLIAEPA